MRKPLATLNPTAAVLVRLGTIKPEAENSEFVHLSTGLLVAGKASPFQLVTGAGPTVQRLDLTPFATRTLSSGGETP